MHNFIDACQDIIKELNPSNNIVMNTGGTVVPTPAPVQIVIQELKEGLHISYDGFLICLPPHVSSALKIYFQSKEKEE